MSAAQISTFVEYIQVNTQANPGTILLPNAADVAGRMLTFKDIQGTFNTNFLTLSTISGNSFDDGSTSKILREKYGYLKIGSDGVSKWNLLEGTQMNMYSISTLSVTAGFSSFYTSTSLLSVSTLQMNDNILSNVQSNVTAVSTLLYYGTQVVGGSRVAMGPTLLGRVPTPFIPNQISGLALWLDAADQNTFSSRGSIWYDKSGTLNHATTGTPGTTNMPTKTIMNGLPAAQFIAANLTSAKTRNNINAFSVTYFIVFRVNGVTAGASQQWLLINNTDGQRQLQVYNPSAPANTFPTQLYSITNSLTGANLITSSINQTQVYMVAWTVPSTTAGTSYTYLNGSITASTNQTPLFTPNTANSQTYIGSANGTSGYVTADIGEILIYNSDFSSVAILQRQTVEGYLAWKWGMVSSLPESHPYKFRPPTTN